MRPMSLSKGNVPRAQIAILRSKQAVSSEGHAHAFYENTNTNKAKSIPNETCLSEKDFMIPSLSDLGGFPTAPQEILLSGKSWYCKATPPK